MNAGIIVRISNMMLSKCQIVMSVSRIWSKTRSSDSGIRVELRVLNNNSLHSIKLSENAPSGKIRARCARTILSAGGRKQEWVERARCACLMLVSARNGCAYDSVERCAHRLACRNSVQRSQNHKIIFISHEPRATRGGTRKTRRTCFQNTEYDGNHTSFI
jgi:hypothetical protein